MIAADHVAREMTVGPIHTAVIAAKDCDGNQHHFVLRWTDATREQMLDTLLGWAFDPEHLVGPIISGGLISKLKSDGVISFPEVCAAYKRAHARQLRAMEAESGVQSCLTDHARDVDCGAAVEPVGEKADARDSADTTPAVGSDQGYGRQDCKAPARRRSRARVFLLGFAQAVVVAVAIASIVFSFAWGD